MKRKTNRRRPHAGIETLKQLAASTLIALLAGSAFYFACTLGDKL